MNFSEQTVLITGAAGALGQTCARRFAEAGGNLVLLDLSVESLEKTFPDWRNDSRYLMLATDLTAHDSAEASAAQALEHFGKLDVLVNVAGGFTMGEKVHATSSETWRRMLELNVLTLINMTTAVVPKMLAAGSGKIVNIAAGAALQGQANMGAYCASKSAVIRLTESQAAELREHNINVNCVLPSVFDTPANRAAMPGADFSRWVPPEALADALMFLASHAARAVHGAALPVRGLS